MIAIVLSIHSQSVHALALNAGLMDNDAGRYYTYMGSSKIHELKVVGYDLAHII